MIDIVQLTKAVRQMEAQDFDKLPHPKRLQVLELYRRLAEPMDNLWRAMVKHVANKPLGINVIQKKKVVDRKGKRGKLTK